jgi:hypothetical protein
MSKHSLSAQGTIEYLLIVGIIVIVALGVVGLLSEFVDNGGSANADFSKMYWQSQSLAITESVQDENGKLLIIVKNNFGEQVTMLS